MRLPCKPHKNLPPVNRLTPCEVTMLRKGNASFAAKRLRKVPGFAGFHAGQRESCCAPRRAPCAISILCIRPRMATSKTMQPTNTDGIFLWMGKGRSYERHS